MYSLYLETRYIECQGTLYVEPGGTLDYTLRYMTMYVKVPICYVAGPCDLMECGLNGI